MYRVLDTSAHAVKYPLFTQPHILSIHSPMRNSRMRCASFTSGHFNSDMRFVSMVTRDPPRDFMRTYETGMPYERLADVIISDGRARTTIEALVLSFQA